MDKFDSVTDYIDQLTKWKREVILLRELCIEAGLEEGLKWSIPTYMVNKKNVLAIAAFQNYVGIWFFNGVFLKDPYKKLINAKAGTTKGQLQWRFTTTDEIEPKKIRFIFMRQSKMKRQD